MFKEIVNIYTAIFLGLFVGGETVLLPALYFAVIGKLSLGTVTLLSVIATFLSDLLWYTLGRTVPISKLLSFSILKNRKEHIALLSDIFDKNNLNILFSSKYVYGVRTLVQILCGVHRMPFGKYATINTLSILLLNGIYIVFAKIVYMGMRHTPSEQTGLLLAFALLTLLLMTLFFQIVVKTYVWKQWFQR